MRFQSESKAHLGEEVIGGREQSRKGLWLSMQLNYGMQALQNKLKFSIAQGRSLVIAQEGLGAILQTKIFKRVLAFLNHVNLGLGL